MKPFTSALLGGMVGAFIVSCGGGGGGPMGNALAQSALQTIQSLYFNVAGDGPDASPGICGMAYRNATQETLFGNSYALAMRCKAYAFENDNDPQLAFEAILTQQGLLVGLDRPLGPDPVVNDRLEVRAATRSEFLGLNADNADGIQRDAALLHRVNGGTPEWQAGWLPASMGTGEDYVIVRHNPAVDAVPVVVFRCSWTAAAKICG